MPRDCKRLAAIARRHLGPEASVLAYKPSDHPQSRSPILVVAVLEHTKFVDHAVGLAREEYADTGDDPYMQGWSTAFVVTPDSFPGFAFSYIANWENTGGSKRALLKAAKRALARLTGRS